MVIRVSTGFKFSSARASSIVRCLHSQPRMSYPVRREPVIDDKGRKMRKTYGALKIPMPTKMASSVYLCGVNHVRCEPCVYHPWRGAGVGFTTKLGAPGGWVDERGCKGTAAGACMPVQCRRATAALHAVAHAAAHAVAHAAYCTHQNNQSVALSPWL